MDAQLAYRTLEERNGHIEDAYVPFHVALSMDGFIMDSGGEFDPDDLGYPLQQNFIAEEELVTLINDGNWNDRFNRQKEIPKIEKLLGVDLSDICQWAT